MKDSSKKYLFKHHTQECNNINDIIDWKKYLKTKKSFIERKNVGEDRKVLAKNY
jgi:hypothetical protein